MSRSHQVENEQAALEQVCAGLQKEADDEKHETEARFRALTDHALAKFARKLNADDPEGGRCKKLTRRFAVDLFRRLERERETEDNRARDVGCDADER